MISPAKTRTGAISYPSNPPPLSSVCRVPSKFRLIVSHSISAGVMADNILAHSWRSSGDFGRSLVKCSIGVFFIAPAPWRIQQRGPQGQLQVSSPPRTAQSDKLASNLLEILVAWPASGSTRILGVVARRLVLGISAPSSAAIRNTNLLRSACM